MVLFQATSHFGASLRDCRTVLKVNRTTIPLFLRRRTMNLSDALFFLRVLNPRVGLPHGDIGDLRPIGERPSPPPCGDHWVHYRTTNSWALT